MSYARFGIAFLACVGFAGCAANNQAGDVPSRPPPRSVAHVDLQRFAGRWYEIARLPQPETKSCTSGTMIFTLNRDNTLDVVTTCHVGGASGPLRTSRGTATVVNPPANSRLDIKFSDGSAIDYYILRLSSDYSTVAIGTLDRRTLLILHRDPVMDVDEFGRIVRSLTPDGYPTDQLQLTTQPPVAP